ncbi:hypothetical protein QGN29_11460 [Temperatibacter marinus]|uniref:Tetratricopeptide repeat protein n=1 Tax=Temperatibacter marinus TaxID=1456591 RepID=A0AA52H958_9PROT|nr:tetratricopeptide repeat protein [Temperatibacter marinus]WND02167.1 hypothetical protein QGN29_11460 [Temperatibacter marinus]
MKLTVVSIIVASMIASPALATDKKLQSISSKFILEAKSLKANGKLTEAQFALEKALVADPQNASILVALGEIHEAQGHVGKGLKYYRNALYVDPASKHALKNQALAFLKKELVTKAEITREKLHAICKGTCEELSFVQQAITAYKEKKTAELTAEIEKSEETEKQ